MRSGLQAIHLATMTCNVALLKENSDSRTQLTTMTNERDQIQSVPENMANRLRNVRARTI